MITFENANAKIIFDEIGHNYPLIMSHIDDDEEYEITEEMAVAMHHHFHTGEILRISSSKKVCIPIYRLKMIDDSKYIKIGVDCFDQKSKSR